MYDAGFSQNPADPAPNAARQTWSGTMSNSVPALGTNVVTVRAGWSGSVAGIRDVRNSTGSLLVNVLTSSTPGSTTTTNLVADFAFADNAQSSTVFLTPALAETQLAIIPFVFARNAAAPASIDNMTAQQFRALGGAGINFLSFWTGNTNDMDLVNLVGRDAGSGTRVITLAETGYGVNNPIQQRQLDGAGGTTGTTFVDAPFNGGFSSGGSVATVLNAATTTEYAIGYLGLGDAASVPTSRWLKYNGVDYSRTNVISGKYTHWGTYEIANLPTISAQLAAFRAELVDTIVPLATTSTVLISLDEMAVFRGSDGGVVLPK